MGLVVPMWQVQNIMEEGQAQAQVQAQQLGQWQGRSKKTGTLLLMAKKLSYTCSKMS